MVVALGISLGHATRQHLWKWGTILAAGAGLLLLLNNTGILPDTLTQRINSVSRNMRLFDVRTVQTTPENFAIVERMSHLQAGWHMFVQHPLTGIGAGTYTLAYEGTHSFQGTPFAIHPWYTSHGHAHNYYLHIAAETGILGLGAYLLLLALLLVQAYRTMLTTHHWFLRSVAVGCCGIIGAVAVHSLFENLHALNMGVQLGSVWGVLEAMETHTNTNHRSHVG
jgi:O-antigen ligase